MGWREKARLRERRRRSRRALSRSRRLFGALSLLLVGVASGLALHLFAVALAFGTANFELMRMGLLQVPLAALLWRLHGALFAGLSCVLPLYLVWGLPAFVASLLFHLLGCLVGYAVRNSPPGASAGGELSSWSPD